MKNIYSLVLLLAMLLVPVSRAQERVEKLPKPERLETMTVEFSSTDELLAKGWEQSSPDVWRKTLDNGAEAEIVLGAAAYERARGWLDADIEALRALESLDDEQDLQLFELLLRREKLDKVELPTQGGSDDSENFCGGNAYFEHNYGWQNLAYPFAESQSTWGRWASTYGTATTYALASVCNGGSCTSDIDFQNGSATATSYAYIAPTPTWVCNNHAHGYVQHSSPFCNHIACFTTSWNCGDPIP